MAWYLDKHRDNFAFILYGTVFCFTVYYTDTHHNTVLLNSSILSIQFDKCNFRVTVIDTRKRIQWKVS